MNCSNLEDVVHFRQGFKLFIIRLNKKPTARVGCLMADEEGFEPPIRVTPYSRFRVARIQPLCHSSKVCFKFCFIIITISVNVLNKILKDFFARIDFGVRTHSPIFLVLIKLIVLILQEHFYLLLVSLSNCPRSMVLIFSC